MQTTTNTTTTASSDDQPPAALVPGDVNQDGLLQIDDAVLMSRLLAEDKTAPVSEEGTRDADFDSDGILTVLDLTGMLRKILHGLSD